eukprot:scaffold44244_cov23-Cyclotella_meneghiniana.AAC.1
MTYTVHCCCSVFFSVYSKSSKRLQIVQWPTTGECNEAKENVMKPTPFSSQQGNAMRPRSSPGQQENAMRPMSSVVAAPSASPSVPSWRKRHRLFNGQQGNGMRPHNAYLVKLSRCDF